MSNQAPSYLMLMVNPRAAMTTFIDDLRFSHPAGIRVGWEAQLRKLSVRCVEKDNIKTHRQPHEGVPVSPAYVRLLYGVTVSIMQQELLA
jgi:hypothetical protein